MTDRTGRLTAAPARARRLRHHRNSRGELWVNITSSHLVLTDFVNLDPGYAPALVTAYPALAWARALRRALRASRTLDALRRAGAAGWRAARQPRLAAMIARLAPRPPRVRSGDRARRARRWSVRGQWEARRAAVIARHRAGRRLPLADGSVDHLLCAHVLQELPPRLAGRALAEYARVLRPGGTLHLVLPDLRQAVDHYVRGEIDADELVTWQRRNGGRGPAGGWYYDEHTAQRRLVGAGFKIESLPTPSSRLAENDPASLHLVGVRA
ncbi:methyltransferase family protein [Frankia sp. EI5c]|uniref:class I SAM-dependent methyltransferase n=1 Tax=Frankia sp. EI5c TaxID=683316 RepID=UPI0007C30260|nr:class I SAM-dependent methyltransferase [Frankia sp. EI5c]OAA28755.1 methyltransferase family protein [Frankia sp. EI5c]